MPSALLSLGAALGESLRDLSRRPRTLACLLIFLNSLLVPYLGIVHDAQIYSGLVLNRIDPEFLKSDLFFQFGSQDKYSIFSPLMAPLAVAIGLKPAFFLGYIVSVALFLTALTRFVTRLWPESPGAVIGLIFLATLPVAYGGYVPLHVLEPFLSARIPACALTLWALAEFLDRRWMRTGLLLAAAVAVHPLMALPGIMVIGIVSIQRFYGTRGNVVVLGGGTAILGAILACPPIAFRLFGNFDREWFDLTYQTNCYQFPMEWSADQWFRNLFAIAGLGVAAWWVRKQQSDRATLLAATCLVGVAGFFGCLLFTQLPYALLLKGQAYRWLWLPLALSLPALIDLAWNAWNANALKCRLATIAIVVALGMNNFVPLEFAILFFFVPVFLYGFMTFAKSISWSDKISYSLLGSALVGFAVWGGYRAWIYFSLCDDLQDQANLLIMIEIVVAMLGSGVVLPLILLALAGVGDRLVGVRRAASLVAVAALLQVGLFAWSNSENFREHQPMGDELRFVENFLNERRDGARPICVYSNYGKLGQYWVEWRTQSFYDCFQLAGFVFNRETAIEGKRRVNVVAPFEAAALSKAGWDAFPEMCKSKIEAWLDLSVKHSGPPNSDDVYRLASEPNVDYIVLFKTHVDDLAIARHGNVSIYDCRTLREHAKNRVKGAGITQAYLDESHDCSNRVTTVSTER